MPIRKRLEGSGGISGCMQLGESRKGMIITFSEACKQFISVVRRRADLINLWKAKGEDRAIHFSLESDMSIDDPNEENFSSGSNGLHQPQPQLQHLQQNHLITSQEKGVSHHLEQSEVSTRKLKTSITLPTNRALRELGSERDVVGEGNEVIKKVDETVSVLTQTNHSSRRLSVQDRINMFEKKQEEQTRNSGGKVVVGKSVELRRLSSDVSSSGQAVEKAVLRRWSGASDMSVDLSCEKKENESSASTSCSTSNSHTLFVASSSVSEDKNTWGFKDTGESYKAGLVEDPGLNNQCIVQTHVNISNKEEALESKQQAHSEVNSRAFSGMPEGLGCKEETESNTQLKVFSVSNPQLDPSLALNYSQLSSSSGKAKDLYDQAADGSLFRSFLGGQHQSGLKYQDKSQTLPKASSGGFDCAGVKDQVAPHTHLKASVINTKDDAVFADVPSQMLFTASSSKLVNVRLRDQPANQTQYMASLHTSMHDVSSSKDHLVSQLQSKDLSGKLQGDTRMKDQNASQSKCSSSQGKIKEVGRTDPIFSQTQYEDIPSKEEDSGIPKVKLHRQSSAPEHSNILLGRRDKTTSIYGNGDPLLPSRNGKHSSHMLNSFLTASTDEVQNVRPSKGNQGLNDELQIKANELEKLFAAHKLRVPGDQSGKSVKSKPAQLPEKVSPREPFGSSSNVAEFYDNSLGNIKDNRDYNNSLKHDLGFSEDFRGKFYDMYTEKRNAKLRDEWNSNRTQKEAKLKAMHDSLECSSAEMKAKFALSFDRSDSALYVNQRAQRLRSFNILPATKIKVQQQIESVHSEEDEDLTEFLDQTQYGQEGSFSETLMGEGSTKSVQSKRLLVNRNLSSSNPRNSAGPVPRSSVKSANSNSGRRCPAQPENPLAQSVPNFSDFRKENTKPSSGITKTTRSKLRNYGHTKSSNEELSFVTEDKSRRSHSMKKSSAGPAELNADDVVLIPIRFDKEQSEHSSYDKVPKNSELKPFLRRGNGIGPGAGAGIVKMKASMTSENLKTDEQMECVEKVEEDDSQIMVIEKPVNIVDYPVDSDDDKLEVSKESENSGDLESENGEILSAVGQVDPDSVDELAASALSLFHTFLAPVQDSPGESPLSWNSREHHPFSYAQETSDIDAFADSPMGSPASWNSHPLTQLEADTAQMRKKWGSAQKPLIVANSSSHHQSRKDVTKGFKRLLKFGRKSRGTDSLADWVSVTTSEGDDDTEDGRDFANRSSEDLRKSRMGFSQDGYNDCELFNEQGYVVIHAQIWELHSQRFRHAALPQIGLWFGLRPPWGLHKTAYKENGTELLFWRWFLGDLGRDGGLPFMALGIRTR
ncbi:hypothetical protein GIB67_009002 [Kingdonia uniflora]|uniref:Uncharacterized protein n=1 Tax=Kingdonia uniflora TaxID=39325 RepID=A0A7J7LVP7_9MAGN|nr:hypothetical protein GIB67_009002 [Kingdonia uniflora]